KLLIKEGNFGEGMETALPFVDKALEGKNFDAALGILLEFYRNDVRDPRLLDKMANAYRLKGEREKEIAIREELSQLTGEAPKVEETTEEVAVEPHLETPGTEEAQKEPPMEEHLVPGGKETEEHVKDVSKYLTEAEVYVKYGLADKAIEILNTALNAFPEDKEVRKKLASLGLALPEEAEEVLPEIEEVSIELDAQEELALPEVEEAPELEVKEEAPAEITGELPPQAEDKYPLSKIKEDMEEADFYIQQGLYEDARNICNRILEFHPENEETLSKLRAIDDAAQTILPAPVPPAAESAVESFFDLAAELDGEDFETLTTPSGMREAEKFGFEDIFSEFKKGVDTQLEKEDTETHYNLGIAYKEMGLLDDAIREFQIASADHKIEFDCYNLIGICYVEKGVYKKAVEIFKKGLQLSGISDDEYASMNYELGTAYELSGMTGEALSSYMETSKKNSGFRDVQSKISQLGGSRETKKGRVSYV
ncbi:MAG: hypothetical protein HW382_949, partial [Deltaproteobacteria bacterium]|nr:hypothetical protein [Deltaproteobacteria bacterium]